MLRLNRKRMVVYVSVGLNTRHFALFRVFTSEFLEFLEVFDHRRLNVQSHGMGMKPSPSASA